MWQEKYWCEEEIKRVSGKREFPRLLNVLKFKEMRGRKMKRYGSVIKVKPEKLAEYKKLHADIWPGVSQKITECNIRNYSIYYREGYLFSYFEYIGNNFEADMQKMADDRTTQEWWDVCKPCQEPLETRSEGEWWADMEEVFHQD
jgi:L-rhamnose mutarotase